MTPFWRGFYRGAAYGMLFSAVVGIVLICLRLGGVI